MNTKQKDRILISSAMTAAVLCLLAMSVDRMLRFDGWEARHLPSIELALFLWGFLCAVVGVLRAGISYGNRLILAICFAVFGWTVYVALLMPRGIHN